jgi:hypothetical protein
MTDAGFPYQGLAPFQGWRSAVAAPSAREIDPQSGAKFHIDPDTKVASAGSCFAKRIAESLQEYGFNYYVAEPGPAWLPRERRQEYGYGLFSARYGNIYTTLQLVQLLERCLGRFQPLEESWRGSRGEYLDPFRPTIQPGGFASIEELRADRAAHLAAVRRMLADIDVFVFTLGLTEGFCDRRDGAAYPVCPGRGNGEFDPQRYEFRNLTITENCENLHRAVALLREINQKLKVLLTVSPVPLAATIEKHHVLQSTVYSKSVLRVAAEDLRQHYHFVDYFAAYEIVTWTFNQTIYYQTDRRNVTPEGVDHVMRSFYRHYCGRELAEMAKAERLDAPELSLDTKPCDEEELLAYVSADLAARNA